MRITTRARVAFLIAAMILLVAGIAGSRLAASGAEGGGGGSPTGGGPATGGAPGGGDCGEQVLGTGPDAVVTYTPCPGDDDSLVHNPDGGAQLVEPTPGMADVRPHLFDRAVVEDGGTSVTVYFWSGVEPCYVLDHVDVEHSVDAITITLYEGHDASAGDVACIEIAVEKKVVVQLDEPVGDRKIVDGAA